MLTTTAPSACRAMTPVSMVTSCAPYLNVLLALTFSVPYKNRAGDSAKRRKPVAARGNGMPQKLRAGDSGSEQIIGLAPQAQAADQFLIAGLVRLLQVFQQLTPLIDHLQQTAPRVVVLLVTSKVVGELVDPRREQCDLHFRRPGVGRIATVLGNDLGFLCRFESHFNNPLGPPDSAANSSVLLGS